jgi:hypothetical protein
MRFSISSCNHFRGQDNFRGAEGLSNKVVLPYVRDNFFVHAASSLLRSANHQMEIFDGAIAR